jgi:peptide/nickel transport system ATP-binding protein
VPDLRTGWLDGLPARLAVEAPAPGEGRPPPGLCTFLDRCPVRVAGVCDREPPPRRALAGGKEILCHHPAAELERLQRPNAPLLRSL